MAGTSLGLLGEVVKDRNIRIHAGGKELASVSLDEVRAAWAGAQGAARGAVS
jgi:hypothetical protein